MRSFFFATVFGLKNVNGGILHIVPKVFFVAAVQKFAGITYEFLLTFSRF